MWNPFHRKPCPYERVTEKSSSLDYLQAVWISVYMKNGWEVEKEVHVTLDCKYAMKLKRLKDRVICASPDCNRNKDNDSGYCWACDMEIRQKRLKEEIKKMEI